MKGNFSKEELEILKFIESDLPLDSRPFSRLSASLQVSEEEVVAFINKLIKEGLIKRFGAVVRHTRVGLKSNAMVVWKMDSGQITILKELVKNEKRISHVYVRKTYPGKWEYNLYTMIHAENEEDLSELIENISERTGCDDYRVLKTVKEFKKSSPIYVR